MKDGNKIKKLAEEIVKLELECQNGTNISRNMSKIEQLTRNLSLEEMLAIDTYIQEKKLLTKQKFFGIIYM